MKLPIIEIELGEYGKQVIDFSEYTTITADIVEELHRDAGNYAYIESVSVNLKNQLKQKQAESDGVKGTRYSEVAAEIVKDGGKVTVKAVESVLASDEVLLRFNEEIMSIESDSALITSLLRAMSMRHSNLKKLVELTINGMSMSRNDVKSPSIEDVPTGRVEKEATGTKTRGRKKK